MSEYWIISVPLDENTFVEQKSKVGKLSSVHKLEMPNLKFGSLDELMQVSDELGRVDVQCENLVRRLVDLMGGETEGTVSDFGWNQAKYPARLCVREMRDLLEKEVLGMEGELKGRAGEYNKVKGAVEESKRRATAGLLSRSLYDVVNESDFVLNSEYLVTLLVVVNKNNSGQWTNSYSTLTDMIVPDSTRVIAEEDDYILYSVTLFRTVVDDFKSQCRIQKFHVRDFEYSKEEAEAYRSNTIALQNRLTTLQRPFNNWLRINYQESFSALLHIKILRTFVESVLRYGITNPFLITVLHPSYKNANKLKNLLFDLYSSLDYNFVKNEKIDDYQLRLPGQAEYYPFAFFKLTVDWN